MDVGNIAELNAFLVLDTIRSHGQATRRQLAVELGLSAASVSRIVQRLLAAELVEELPGDRSPRGRTPMLLRFVGPPGSVIAVDLGGTRCHGAVADLSGTVLAEDSRPARAGGKAAGALLDCIAALRARAIAGGMPVRAVVIGIPALIDPGTGLATAGPNVHWQGFDLLNVLRDQLAEPFEVDNDVNLDALGQAWRGAGRGSHSFVTMSIGTGIGGAVVVDGHLIRGRHNAAGEIGYMPVGSGKRGTAGHPAGFEAVASGPALRGRAAELIAKGQRTSLAADFGVAELFTAAIAGDNVGMRVIRELIGHVSAAIVGATALIDPERIILDGSIGRALEPWLPDIRAAVTEQVFRAPQIVVSRLGRGATITGAIARALAIVAELDAPAQVSQQPLRSRIS